MTDYRKQAEEIRDDVTGPLAPQIERALLAAHEAGRREGLEEAAQEINGQFVCVSPTCGQTSLGTVFHRVRALKERKP